jgi:hypothetical protein
MSSGSPTATDCAVNRCDCGSTGYTTRAQADQLARLLQLGPATRVDDYARTQQAWYDATEAAACELRRLTSDHEFATAQADRSKGRSRTPRPRAPACQVSS